MRKISLSLLCVLYLIANDDYSVVLPTIVVEGMSVSDTTLGYVRYGDPMVTRTGISAKDTPFTIETLNIQKNRNYGTNDLSSILEGTAGVDASYDMRGEGIKLRGFDISANDIYQDGIRLSGQVRRSTANIERVEILKGPASVLYGRTNGGGVVNLVSKKANFDSKNSVSIRGGSYDRYGIEIDANNALNESFAFRITGDYEEGRSFRKGVKHKSKMISPSFIYANDSLVFEAQYTYDEAWRVPDRNPSKFEYDKMGISYKQGFARDGDFVEDKLHLFRTNLTYEFSPSWKVEWAFGYRKASQNFDHFYGGTFNEKTKKLSQPYAWQETENKTLSSSFILNGKFDTFSLNHQLTLGYDYQDEDRLPRLATKRNNFIDPFSGNFGTNSHKLVNKTMDNHHKGKTHSLFIHDLISFNDNFKISLGARFDRYKFSSRNIKEESNSYKDDVFSPQAGLIYTFLPGHNFYASYSKSFAPYGGRGYLGISVGDDPATFSEPEYNEQYEIGIKSDWLDERLITTLSFFQNEHNNIRYKPDPQNEPFLWAVRGKERSRGVDFTILGKIYDAWYLRGSLGVMEAKIINDKQNPELVGQRLRNTSEVQGNLFLRYAPNQTWFAEAGITHVGKRYNYSHSSRTKTVTPENLDAFTRIDLMGGYKFSDNLSTTLSIYNLTDEKYWRSNSMPGNGRSFLVKFNYEF